MHQTALSGKRPKGGLESYHAIAEDRAEQLVEGLPEEKVAIVESNHESDLVNRSIAGEVVKSALKKSKNFKSTRIKRTLVYMFKEMPVIPKQYEDYAYKSQ